MVPNIKELRKVCQSKEIVEKDPFYFRYFIRKFSIYISWVFLHTPITANQVTWLHTLFGVVGGLLLALGNYWYSILGVFLIQLHVILDNVDGEVARYRKSVDSVLGPFSDRIGHNLIHPAIFIGLTFGIYYREHNILVFLFGFLSMASYFIITNYQAIWYISVAEATKAGADGMVTIRIPNYRDYKKGYLGQKKLILRYASSFFAGLIYFRMREVLVFAAIVDRLNWMLYGYGLILPLVVVAILLSDWKKHSG